ncbi:cell division protein FtsA [Virgibacillus sp. W0430]|uniref:cell division protein FtsA n=1 Tax=Virgibacillus sp. W0430 TaxID=3391580 RepID=UPI003F451514
MNDQIFALDIGTQSVTGMLLKKTNETFVVVDYCVKEHQARSMLDGQIHNVVAVSEVIEAVRNEMEMKHGPLHKVCVAAAGRALITTEAKATILLNERPITDEEAVKHLELSAVQAAQQKLASSDKNNDFMNYYCVGYSVLHYKLDDELIGSFIDQSGNEATVEIIATFLPKIVVESLLAALERAKLKMEALTLEPIAAIRVLIPPSMRRLNVALIDIGAGTSDIAITDKGTVVAYGMVPVAGDEVTEAISDHYLLDFPIAEQTKRTLVNKGVADVEDILGLKTTVTYEDLIKDISDDVERIADSLAEEIINLNAKPPKAVMLVGGGSLTPGITKALANKLQLPENRVAVRGIDAIQNLQKDDQLPAGPEFVTPIGIAIAAKQNPVHYITVKVNGNSVRMFEMKKLTIGDCLIQAGIELKKMYGKPGLAAMIRVNGKELTLRGGYGGSPTIHLNGELNTVDGFIKDGDEITVTKGIDGKNPHYTVKQLIGEVPNSTIFFNGEPYELKTAYFVNGQQAPDSYIVKDRDNVTFQAPNTIADFLKEMNIDQDELVNEFTVFVNNKRVDLQLGKAQLMLNGQQAPITAPLKHQDEIAFSSSKQPKLIDLLKQINESYWDSLTVTFNGEPVVLKRERATITRNNEQLQAESPLQPNDRITLKERTLHPFIFQDIFRFVEIDLTNANGQYELYRNNAKATFFEELNQGDELNILWN